MRLLRTVLHRAEDALLVLSFALIVLVTAGNVFSRSVLGASWSFTEEITVNTMVVLTMVGAVVALREGSHLGFSLLRDRSRGALHRVLVVTCALVVLAVLLVFAVYGTELVLAQADRGRATPALGIPQWVFTACIPLVGVLGILHTVTATVRELKPGTEVAA
ncbi:TRAP transporter small permease [Brevibacterium litoralis]|uniref:TRAP transporter small permease n=1 Tax=Brevibacterium litoralis TaxID=3138935 RepID=UPI0032EFAEC7